VAVEAMMVMVPLRMEISHRHQDLMAVDNYLLFI
jgi:hypothetical protein